MTSHPSNVATNKRKLSKRKKALGLFLIGNLLPICYVLWMCFGPPRDIPISKETTFITAPLSEDGRYVDYEAYFKDRIGQHDPNEDPWRLLYLADLSPSFAVSAYPLPRPGETNAAPFDLPLGMWLEPFTHKSRPARAREVLSMERASQAAIKAKPGPVGLWWRDLFYEIHLPLSTSHDWLVRNFELRAAMAFGEEDYPKAIESVEFMLKVAERENSVPFLVAQHLGSVRTERALNSLCTGLLYSSEMPEHILRQWDAKRYAPDWAQWRKAIHYDRLRRLEMIQKAHRSRASAGPFSGYAGKFGRSAGNWFIQRVDFDAAMRAVNSSFDKVDDAFAITDFLSSDAAIQKIDKAIVSACPSVRTSQTEPTFKELLTENHTAWVAQTCARVRSLQYYRSRIASMQNAWRRVRICIRLHIYRNRNGQWPKSLADLGQLEGWTEDATELFTDAYSGEAIKFFCDERGFVIYSVGRNGTDETNGRFPDRADPFAWSNNGLDDEFWPWPPIKDSGPLYNGYE